MDYFLGSLSAIVFTIETHWSISFIFLLLLISKVESKAFDAAGNVTASCGKKLYFFVMSSFINWWDATTSLTTDRNRNIFIKRRIIEANMSSLNGIAGSCLE